MSGRTYRDVQIIADGATVDADGIRRLSVRAQVTQGWEHPRPRRRSSPPKALVPWQRWSGGWSAWELPEAEVIVLGAALADLLLPSGSCRQLLADVAGDRSVRTRACGSG